MSLKKYIFIINIFLTQARAQTNVELRAKVLNALRTSSESAEIKVTHSDSDSADYYKFSFKDLDPQSLQFSELSGDKNKEHSELSKLGINSEILTYSFYNSENSKPFGLDKKFHITYTAVSSASGSLSHFLVYYDKKNFYPIKVTYFNGNKKITTVEYKDYRKLKNKIWRAYSVTSENHLNQKKTYIEFTKIDINPQLKTAPRLGTKAPIPTL